MTIDNIQSRVSAEKLAEEGLRKKQDRKIAPLKPHSILSVSRMKIHSAPLPTPMYTVITVLSTQKIRM